MTFRASYRENPLFWILSFVGLLGVVAFSIRRFSPGGVFLSSLFLLFPLVLRLRCRVTITGDTLTSASLFHTQSIAWTEILAVERPFATGRKTHGPFTFIFRGAHRSVTINFKLFSRACAREVLSRLPETVSRS